MKYIAISGPDRCGKETQTKLLVDYINKHSDYGDEAVRIEIPFNGRWYTTIYKWLKNGNATKFPTLFQTIHFLNKLWFQTFNLPKLSLNYDIVVFDRWKLSSIVYGKMTGVPSWIVNLQAKFLLDPDCIIILDSPTHGKESRDVYEADKNLQSNIRQEYIKIAKTLKNTVVIDGSQSIEVIHEEIITKLKSMNIIC